MGMDFAKTVTDVVAFLWAHHAEIGAGIVTFLLASESLVVALLAVAVAIEPLTRYTPWEWDDEAIHRAVATLERWAHRLPSIRTALQRRLDGSARTGSGSGMGGIVALCLALTISGTSIGCAGSAPSPADARIARTDLVLGGIEQGLLSAGEALVPFYQVAETRCNELPDQLAYQRCIHRWDIAIDSLSSTYYLVRTARNGLGASDGADKIPCIAQAVENAISAVNALGLNLPDAVQTGLNAAKGLAGILGGDCRVEPPQ